VRINLIRFNLLKDKQHHEDPEKKKFYQKFSAKQIIWISIALCFSILLIYAGIILFSLPGVTDLKNKNPKTTAFIELRKSQAKKKGKSLTISQNWVSFKTFPKFLKQAVRLSEDAGFYGHNGIDFYELREAIKKDLNSGKKVRGGSTITMQLAKNLFLSPRKSYIRKIKELLIAKRLERHLSKNRIFHIYLNIVELGRGIFGFEAAAKHYFSKSAEYLIRLEILRLVAILPRPLKANPKSDSRYIKWRIGIICSRMVQAGILNPEEQEQLLENL